MLKTLATLGAIAIAVGFATTWFDRTSPSNAGLDWEDDWFEDFVGLARRFTS
jgi:hypothetical protein